MLCICILGMVTAEASKYQLGDVYKNNIVDASDALFVLKNAAGLEELDDEQQFSADVNQDGQINADDALQILKVAAKIDVFRITVELSVGQEYVIDKIYDAGAYWWKYEMSTESGIFVDQYSIPIPDDPLKGPIDGEPYEQVYTITAEKPGTYEIHFKLCEIGDATKSIAEARVYMLYVKGEAE